MILILKFKCLGIIVFVNFRPSLEMSEEIQEITVEEGDDITEPSKPKVGTSPINPGKACYRVLFKFKKING